MWFWRQRHAAGEGSLDPISPLRTPCWKSMLLPISRETEAVAVVLQADAGSGSRVSSGTYNCPACSVIRHARLARPRGEDLLHRHKANLHQPHSDCGTGFLFWLSSILSSVPISLSTKKFLAAISFLSFLSHTHTSSTTTRPPQLNTFAAACKCMLHAVSSGGGQQVSGKTIRPRAPYRFRDEHKRTIQFRPAPW